MTATYAPAGIFRLIARMIDAALTDQHSPYTIPKTPDNGACGYLAIIRTHTTHTEAWTIDLTEIANELHHGGDHLARLALEHATHSQPRTYPAPNLTA